MNVYRQASRLALLAGLAILLLPTPGSVWAQMPRRIVPGNMSLSEPDTPSPRADLVVAARTGLANPLAYACGIPVGDAAVHVIGKAPAGSCFAGVTTLAQLAALRIGGITPFSFLTDSGIRVGPRATWAGRLNPFTSRTGAYRLTDAKVPALDIAWLAIQAAAITGGVYLPTGNYVVGSALPLPIMLINHFSDVWSHSGPGLLFLGDGPGRTIITAGSSFGMLPDGLTTIPLMSCGDPGATPANKLGRWYPDRGQCDGLLQGIMLWGDPGATRTGLQSAYRTDGLALGARLATVDVQAAHFRNDITFTGDHTLHTRLRAVGGVFGAYWTPPNAVLTGDWQFIDFAASGQSFASVRVDGATSINGIFEGETYLNAAYYAIFGDADGCANIIYNARFSRLYTELLGLAAIHDDHVFDEAHGSYTDVRKCRSVDKLQIGTWFNQFSNQVVPASTRRRRRALIDVHGITGELLGLDPNGGGFMPVADRNGPAGIAMINVNLVGSDASPVGLDLAGQMSTIFKSGESAGIGGQSIPVLPAVERSKSHAFLPALGVTWQEPGGNGGIFSAFQAKGSYVLTGTGDLMEMLPGQGPAVVPAGYSLDQPVIGIAAQAGLADGMIVPLQTRGLAFVSSDNATTMDGPEVKSTGIGGGTRVVGGGGGGDGAYTIEAAGCAMNPSFTVTVLHGAISAVRQDPTRVAAGCIGQPTLSLDAISGLVGAGITLQWPAAGISIAPASPERTIVGYGVHARQGVASGKQQIYSRLFMSDQ